MSGDGPYSSLITFSTHHFPMKGDTTHVPETPLLEIRALKTHFFTDEGVVPAVDGVDLEIPAHGTLGLVGESGCGKSVTGFSILRLVAPPGRIVSGSIRFGGKELVTATEAEMRRIRGAEIAMIF